MSAVRPSAPGPVAAAEAATPALPGVLPLGIHRIRYEVRRYFRQSDTVIFTFLFPVIMLSIFSVAFGSAGNLGTAPDGSGGVSAAAYYLPGMIAAGILLSGVQNLAVDIAMERSDGTLKRLAGSPLPVLSYFIGKAGQVIATSVLQVLVLLLVARFAFGVELPTDAGRWVTFAWVYALGITTSAVLGIALSRIPRSGASATAVITPIVLVLQFISGVYLAFTMLPTWLQDVASFLPLKWMAQGMRAVFLPDALAAVERGGAWDLGGVLAVLAIWLVGGTIAAMATFRWIRRDS
ncbi:ABC transporter permease [Clavibacter sp. Sh2141]|uniref:ABC transporter permease n=1 Tax=Clavibacter sp. Sh2141 TaxID=3395374 RepID=UPI0039BD2733